MPRPTHWAVVLAGGEGRRMQSLTRCLVGDDRPKQYCRLLGRTTLLSETIARVTPHADPGCTLCVVTRTHERFYRPELARILPSRILEQPSNRGTAVAIAATLARIRAFTDHAIVGFFPADHYYANPDALHQTLRAAYAAARTSSRVILLGATATSAETDYGWVQPGEQFVDGVREKAPVQPVAGFWEKPQLAIAKNCFEQGCLWNTFITVGRLEAFEHLLDAAQPGLRGHFETLALGKPAVAPSQAELEGLYDGLPISDFSREALSAHPERLGVVPLRDSGWTDLGQPDRVVRLLATAGLPAPRLRPAAS